VGQWDDDEHQAWQQALTGGSSCGWSDHFSVTANVVGGVRRNAIAFPFTLATSRQTHCQQCQCHPSVHSHANLMRNN
jgi:hypothetical protein